MAVIQIPNLPVATALTGTELLELVQAGVSCRTTTQDVANLATGLSFPGYYGQYFCTTTQVNVGSTSANVVTFNSLSPSSGTSLTSSTRMTVTNAGIYELNVSVQIEKSDAGNSDVDVWLRKNASDVGSSNSRVTLTGASVRAGVSKTYIFSMGANDYLEVAWSSSNVNVFLPADSAGSSPSRPSIAAVIATLTLAQEP